MAAMVFTRRGTDTKAMRRQLHAAKRDKKPELFWSQLREGLESKQIKPEDFSIRKLFEELVPNGRELCETFSPSNKGNSSYDHILEAGVVDTSDFANIGGQITYTKILEAFENPLFIGGRLTTTVTTIYDGERIPGIGLPGSSVEAIGEGNPYPMAGVNEEWIDTPLTTKRGMIVPVTKEAIFFDRTNVLLTRAATVGDMLGIKKERLTLAAVLGTINTYNRNSGGTQAAYGSTHTQGDFNNLSGTTALVDWTDIEAALLLFDRMTDPNTGDPVLVTPRQIVVPTVLMMTAQHILNATEIAVGIHGDTSASTITKSGDALPSYELISGPWVRDTTISDSTWYIGDFPRAFNYMENWPITLETQDRDSDIAFTHDIVSRFKASERGIATAIDPRYAVKCTQ